MQNTCAYDITKVDGIVGQGYWAKFKKRNSYLIVSKREHKFELERKDWYIYSNFDAMHDNISDTMVDPGNARVNDPPVADDKGYCCTYDIMPLDYFLIADKLGRNISQKGDGHKGGVKYLCRRGSIPKK